MNNLSELWQRAYRLVDSDPQNAADLCAELRRRGQNMQSSAALAHADFIDGLCCRYRGDLNDAATFLTRASEGFLLLGDEENYGGAQHRLSDILRIEGDLAGAESAELRHLAAARNLQSPEMQTVAYRGLGIIALQAGDLPAALNHLRQGLRFVNGGGLEHQRAALLQSIALVYKQSGLIEQALASIRMAEEALPLARQDGIHGFVYNTLANVYQEHGQRSIAIEYFRRAAEVFAAAANVFDEIICRVNIAQMLVAETRYEAAELQFDELLRFAEDRNHARGRVAVLTASASLQLRMGNESRALDLAEKALRAAELVNDALMRARARMLRATCRLRVVDSPETRKELTAALDCAEREGDQLASLNLLREAAVVLEERGARKQSVRILKRALRRADKGPYLEVLADLHHDLHRLYSALDNAGEASCHLEQALEVQRAISAAERSNLLDRQTIAGDFELIRQAKGNSTNPGGRADIETRLRERLHTLCPSLTIKEERVCVLLFNNMETKEIAQVLCVSPRTVEWHRNKLRRKLAVPGRESLTNHLRQLVAADQPQPHP